MVIFYFWFVENCLGFVKWYVYKEIFFVDIFVVNVLVLDFIFWCYVCDYFMWVIDGMRKFINWVLLGFVMVLGEVIIEIFMEWKSYLWRVFYCCVEFVGDFFKGVC